MPRTTSGLSRLLHRATRLYEPVFDISSIRERAQCQHAKCYRPLQNFSFSKRFSCNVARAEIQVSKDDSDLLSLSYQYGITSTSELDKESNFDSLSRDHDKRLTDVDPYRQDLSLWSILLDYQIRHYGSKGATNIWRGLKYGGPRVSLESNDPLTNSIWQRLLTCAAEYDDLGLMKRLCEHNGIAWNRPRLFAETITALLRAGRGFEAGVMCDELKSKHRNGIADVLDLYSTFQPQHHDALKAFCLVYAKVRPGKMYGQGTKQLWAQDRPKEAFLLHEFLISRGDFPTSFSEIEPFMIHLAEQSEDPGPFLRHLAASGVVFSGQGREVYRYKRRKLVSTSGKKVVDETKGLEAPWANKISDSFAAKAFATKALSFEFVLNSLRAFGLREIGPQSIREIGLNTQDLESMLERLAKLDELGVDTGGSAYARFIRKTCKAREPTLLQQALLTDMHHDVFEDNHLQLRLLVESLNKCAWTQVNLLLAMINRGHSFEFNNPVKSAILELVVEDDLKSRSLLTLLSNLVGAKDGFPNTLFGDLADCVILQLKNAKGRNGLSHTNYRRLAQFTAGMLQECTTIGARLSVLQWKMLLGQLGKAGALEEVHKMTLWLAVWHSEQAENMALTKQSIRDKTPILQSIFNGGFQGALAYWALREQFHKEKGRTRDPWQTTLALLQYLQNDCGVPIHLWTIRKTIVLFIRGLHHKSAPVLRTHRTDSRKADSRKLCAKLFKALNEYWPRGAVTADSEQEVARFYLLEQKSPRANEVTLAARPTFRRALRRLPAARLFSTHSSRSETALLTRDEQILN